MSRLRCFLALGNLCLAKVFFRVLRLLFALILFLLNHFITLGGHGQLLMLACVATAVPILGDLLTGQAAKQEQRRVNDR